MKHLYIALYAAIDRSTGKRRPYGSSDIMAENDQEAYELAVEKAGVFEEIEEILPGNQLLNGPVIIVSSIRDQDSRRTTFLNGYTVDE